MCKKPALIKAECQERLEAFVDKELKGLARDLGLRDRDVHIDIKKCNIMTNGLLCVSLGVFL